MVKKIKYQYKKMIKKRKRETIDKSTKRDLIISTCHSILMEKGYRDATMRDFAKACQMSTGGLYHYIKSKNNLLQIVYERGVNEAKSLLETSTHNGDTRAIFKDEVAKWLAVVDTDKPFVRFAYRDIKFLPKKTMYMILGQESRLVQKEFISILENGIREGVFREVNVKLLAFMLYLLGHHWALGSWFFRDNASLEEYSSFISDILLYGISKPDHKKQEIGGKN